MPYPYPVYTLELSVPYSTAEMPDFVTIGSEIYNAVTERWSPTQSLALRFLSMYDHSDLSDTSALVAKIQEYGTDYYDSTRQGFYAQAGNTIPSGQIWWNAFFMDVPSWPAGTPATVGINDSTGSHLYSLCEGVCRLLWGNEAPSVVYRAINVIEVLSMSAMNLYPVGAGGTPLCMFSFPTPDLPLSPGPVLGLIEVTQAGGAAPLSGLTFPS